MASHTCTNTVGLASHTCTNTVGMASHTCTNIVGMASHTCWYVCHPLPPRLGGLMSALLEQRSSWTPAAWRRQRKCAHCCSNNGLPCHQRSAAGPSPNLFSRPLSLPLVPILTCKPGLSPCATKYPPPFLRCVPSNTLSQSATVSICPLYCTRFG